MPGLECPECGGQKSWDSRICVVCYRKTMYKAKAGKVYPKVNGRVVGVASALWSHPNRWVLDKRLALAKHLDRVRAQLVDLFPKKNPGAAALIIDRIVFKQLKLAMFEGMDMAATAAATGPPGEDTHRPENQGSMALGHKFPTTTFQMYVSLSNSLREDIRLIFNMANRTAPEQSDPDLNEYLAELRKAAKATNVNVHRIPAKK